MATVKHRFQAADAFFPASNFAQYSAVAGTNFPVASLAFDAATEETVYFQVPTMDYGSGNLTINLKWYADTASSGGVTFGASLACITANTDSTDIETKAFGSENTASDTHLGTTGQRLHEFSITLSNLDSIATNDYAILKLARKVSDGSDTMTGDCLIVEVGVEYSDT